MFEFTPLGFLRRRDSETPIKVQMILNYRAFDKTLSLHLKNNESPSLKKLFVPSLI